VSGSVISEIGAGAQGQRVGEPDQAGGAPQLGHQHPGVRLVALPGLHQILRRDREMPASRVIQQAAEQRFGPEAPQFLARRNVTGLRSWAYSWMSRILYQELTIWVSEAE
jgi:hypothetical protein